MLVVGFTSNTPIWRVRSVSPLVFALLCALLAIFVEASRVEKELEESQPSVVAARNLGQKTKTILTRSIEALNVADDNALRTLDLLNEGRDLVDIAKIQTGACDVMLASTKAWVVGSPDRQKVLNAISAESHTLDADELKPTWKNLGQAFKTLTCPTEYDKEAVKERFQKDLQAAMKTRAVQQLHISVAAVMGDVLSACLPSYDLDGDFPTLDKFSETKNFVFSEFQAWLKRFKNVGEHWVNFKKHLDKCKATKPSFNTITGLGDMIMSDPETQFDTRWKFQDVLNDLEDFIVCKLEHPEDGMNLARKAQYLRTTWAHAYKYKMYDEPNDVKTMKERLMNPCINKILSEPQGQQRRPQQPKQHVQIPDPTSSFTTQQKRISQLMRERLSAELALLEKACKSDSTDNPCGTLYKKLAIKCHPDKVADLKKLFNASHQSDDELTADLTAVTQEWFKYVNDQNARCNNC